MEPTQGFVTCLQILFFLMHVLFMQKKICGKSAIQTVLYTTYTSISVSCCFLGNTAKKIKHKPLYVRKNLNCWRVTSNAKLSLSIQYMLISLVLQVKNYPMTPTILIMSQPPKKKKSFILIGIILWNYIELCLVICQKFCAHFLLDCCQWRLN